MHPPHMYTIAYFIAGLLLPRSYAQSCGPDCSSCSSNDAACSADNNCFFIVDNQLCRLKNTCSSDCRLCLSQTDCTTIGAGGIGNLCAWNPSSNVCFGITCDTDCSNCSPVQQDPANPGQTFCESSRAPPRGCEPEGTEECLYKSPEPTTLEPTTSAMPTATPTTSSPTIATTEASTTDETTDSDSDSDDDEDSPDDGDDSMEDGDDGDDDSDDKEEMSADTESDEDSDDDDDEGDSDDDDDECAGLSYGECADERDSAGDNVCGYNVETHECYPIVRRAGLNGVGTFDDGFVTAHSVAKAEADKLFTVVGVLASIGGTLLIVAVIGAYYMWRESVIRRKAEYTQTVMNATL